MWRLMESERALLIIIRSHSPEPIGNYVVCGNTKFSMQMSFDRANFCIFYDIIIYRVALHVVS